MTLSDILLKLAVEIEWLDDVGAFPRSFSYLALRAQDIAKCADATAVREFLDEPDLRDAVRAISEGTAGSDPDATARSLSFLSLHKELVEKLRQMTPPPVSFGSGRIETSLRTERPRHTPPKGTIIIDDT